ncbi:response regulator [Microbacterium sediminis]|uniref:Response regulator n=1 Tax=Microbacterium sediminis TaxID=904291 RepID=A0A1B9NIV2_9MICO|nr:response regulator [Microbacterium sediminis]OCG76532.1 response regulator [Microbacterium sediminis]QBR73863.1 response regulator [Microbacterium sediminis]
MAIARLHGGPLDGQVLPLDSPDLDQLIMPYAEGQLVYRREGAAENTGDDDGPTSFDFHFDGEVGDINSTDDDEPKAADR